MIALNKTQSRDERPDGLHRDCAKYRSVSVCLCLVEVEWEVCVSREKKVGFFFFFAKELERDDHYIIR